MLESIQHTVWKDVFYNAFLVIGLLTAISFGIWYRKRFKFSVWNAILLSSTGFIVLLIWTVVHFQIESRFTGVGTQSVVRAMPYLMLMVWLLAAMLKLKWDDACDFFAPLVCLYLGIAQMGCIFAGCCQGYPCNWGIYNYHYDGFAFPIQIIEIISIFVLFFVILWYNKQHNYKSNGQAIPIMLIVFGLMRFLWEFARNNEKLFAGCSAISFHALFMVAVGIEMLFTIQDIKSRKNKKIGRYKHNFHKKRRQK